MRDSQAVDKVRDLVDKYDGNISVLEEEIDVELQIQYFKTSKECKKNLDREYVLERKEDLFTEDISYEDKRSLLCKLASIDDVAAYRSIELYNAKSDFLLEEWSKLAYQESKMLLQSALLDQAPLFISTGLGGKGTNLRYFCVISSKDYKPFTHTQEKVIRSEFEFGFRKHKAEIESIECCGYYAVVTVLIPLEVGLKKLFKGIIMNCNDLGDFLNTSFLITNVKKLSYTEIEEIIAKERNLEVSRSSNIK